MDPYLERLDDVQCPPEQLLILADLLEEAGRRVESLACRMIYGRKSEPLFKRLGSRWLWCWRLGCGCPPATIFSGRPFCESAMEHLNHLNHPHIVGASLYYLLPDEGTSRSSSQDDWNFRGYSSRRIAYERLITALSYWCSQVDYSL